MTSQENADLFCKEWLEGKSTFTIKTSGSTGTPKIIELHRDQMIASAQKTIKALDLREGMTALVCLDPKYIAGRMMIVRSLVAGMKIIVVEPSANPLENVEAPIDFVALVPYQLDLILKSPQRDKLNSISKIILGGSAISAHLHSDIQELDAHCYATFGMTETLSHIALQKLNGNDQQDFFEVLEGIDISVDNRGCLVIKADYLHDTVVTNDVVELIARKRFRWLGRWDNVINSGAVKIFPETIEKIIAEYFLSRDIRNSYFIAGVPHEQLGEQVVLVIEGLLSNEIENDLSDHLEKSLDRYEVPKQVLYATQFTTTPTGKVNRSLSVVDALPRLSP